MKFTTACLLFLLSPFSSYGEVDFAKDVRPILSEYCFYCHGPDEKDREGKLRLDTLKGPHGAFRVRKKRAALVPGDLQKSHVYLRITSDDEDDIMPPPEYKKEMKAAEKKIIKEWIEQGAQFRGHWAFDVPQKATLPKVKKKDWPSNDIDHFVLAELEANGMIPSEKASSSTLVRRLYLDLTGLPPSVDVVKSFVASQDPKAYENLVDQLLATPAHAERLTVEWLDAARYADTNGYSIDDHRDMWAWRDWVINAYMTNMPFDQFLTEQLAGDLLPKPKNSSNVKPQKPLPVLAKNPFWIWKKGKITTEKANFKKSFTLKGKVKKAFLQVTCDNSFKMTINGKTVAESADWDKPLKLDVTQYLKKGKNDIFVEASNEGEEGRFIMLLQAGKLNVVSDRSWLSQAPKGEWQPAVELKAYGAAPWGKIFTLPVFIPTGPVPNEQKLIATGFLRNSMNTHEGGTIAEEYRVQYHVDKVDTVATTFMGLTVKCAQCHDHKFDPISQKDFYKVYAFFNDSSEGGKGAGRGGNSNPKIYVNAILTPRDKMIKAYKKRIVVLQELKKNLDPKTTLQGFGSQSIIKSLDVEISVLNKQIQSGKTSVMVMDYKPRKTYVLERGQYSVNGPEVQPGALDQILKFKSSYPKNRLGLTQWLLDEENPLTARVAVNRYWKIIFGTGIVKTSEDFGSQGEFPSHPELLDFLAVELRQNKWNVRKLIKKIVMSATYRQSSKSKPQYALKDPYNRLMWKAPSFRLAAEFLRDNALAISGILSFDLGGPSVYSQQPRGLWAQVSHFGYGGAFTSQAYFDAMGDSLYRRSLYTVIKRTALHPTMAAFDAPSREVCSARRLQTNTPIQSLVVMNDPQFVNAARFLALRMKTKSSELAEQLQFGFQLATARQPLAQEKALLKTAYLDQLKYYRAHSGEVEKLLLTKGTAADAAMVMLASTLLNLSETMTRN